MDTGRTHNDDDLIWFFENFESVIDGHKPTADQIATGVDFYVFREYLIKDTQEIQWRLTNADDDYLLSVCEHIFNIIEWINLINGTRSLDFGEALEHVFEQEFNNKHILQSLYNESMDRWLQNKEGQYKLGGNTYSILDKSLYYRDRFKNWFQVEKESAFDLQPNKQSVGNRVIIAQLDDTYQPTLSDSIIQNWDNQNFQNSLPDNFLQFDKDLTTPEEYFGFTIPQIKSLLSNPISIEELEKWYGDSIDNLEHTIKLGALILDMVKDRRKTDGHTIYLLRDCLVFYEIHKALDILDSDDTSSDQLLIGRNFLSHKKGLWEYYIVTLEALYEAHRRYPNDFTNFYNEYVRLLDLLISVNPKFLKVVNIMATYINKHIQTTKHKVVIFDVGFQGSINLLIKYVIDRHINAANVNKIETEIEIGIGAQWSKELFRNRFKGDYFPFLNRVQLMARSNELYHYEFDSFNADDGTVQVKMGDTKWQRKAAVELAVCIMIAKLSDT